MGINRRGEQLFGATRGEMIGKPTSVVVPPEGREAWRKRLEEVLVAGESHRNDVPVCGLDGVRRLVDFSTSVVRFGDERVMLTFARDASERARIEAQLRQAQKMEAVARLTGGIAHDFNNILAAILAHSHFLLDDLSPDDPRRADADEVRAAAERGAALTRQLLAFSRSQVLEPTIVDLNVVVGGLEKMLRRLIGEDIELRIVRAPGLGAVRADSGQIEQVIMNLVVNSRDAMPLGGTLTIETANVDLDAALTDDYTTIEPGRWVMVAVRDTGTGMDADTLRRVFDPFFTTKEKGRGTGLGLSVSYGIVQQSGGTIGVTSRPGQGATFRVYLPRVADGEVHAVTTRPVKAAARGSETVLVVEDDDRVRAVVKRMLIDHGYRVLLARNADEALGVCASHAGPIELMLSDVVMPGKTGVELVSDVRATRPEMRCLLMTGYSDHAVMRTADPEIAFIQKPFGPDALARKVREVLS
jgi:PAS domain S-box-containing protein